MVGRCLGALATALLPRQAVGPWSMGFSSGIAAGVSTCGGEPGLTGSL